MNGKIVSPRRRKRQGGQEIIEFALVGLLLCPMLVGAFVTGMNLVRSIQTNQMCRDLGNMYIHGQDFSVYQSQKLAQRLANGLNLQVGSDPGTSVWNNTSNAGNGIVTITKVMYVGSNSSPVSAQCTYVGAANCTNHDSFVYMERMQFGNGTLYSQSPSSLGTLPTGITINSSGVVQNPVTDANAKVPSAAQTGLANLFEVSTGGQTPLVDGQTIYVAETFFQSPDLSVSYLSGKGVYARYFF